MLVKLTEDPINCQEVMAAVRHPSCGAVVVFEGNIRNENEGKKVVGLQYEVYEELFRTEVGRIAQEIREKWKIHEVALAQRIGKLDVGETGLVIAVSGPHRREALEALSYAIEEFKKWAPVWKKEYYDSSSDGRDPGRRAEPPVWVGQGSCAASR